MSVNVPPESTPTRHMRTSGPAGSVRPSDTAKRGARHGDRRPAIPELLQDPTPLHFKLLDRLQGSRRFGDAAGQLGILGAPEPFAVTLDRLEHEHVRHRLVVGERLRGFGLDGRGAHHTNGTQAIGTPASDWRAFSVAVIQLSPSGSRTEAGRTRQRSASSTLAGTTPRSRKALAASISRRLTRMTIASVVPRCSSVRS